jgi:F0F1-type ATP synthase membrane subunit b/b'
VNWAVWGPILGSLVVALLGLAGGLVKVWKDHHAAMAQADAAIIAAQAARDQADAARIQAEAALEAARASVKTAEATAAAAIQDTFTRAYKAADEHWARYTNATEHRCQELEQAVSANAKRIDEADLRAEADRVARNEAEKKLRLAVAWMRSAIRWIKENLPGLEYPPVPPEIELELDL